MMREQKPQMIASLSRHKGEKFCCDGSSPDDIFITGISGRFPFTDTVGELKEKLYAKKKFLQRTENRWKEGLTYNKRFFEISRTTVPFIKQTPASMKGIVVLETLWNPFLYDVESVVKFYWLGTLGFPPAEYGNINYLNKLDADFFNIPYVNCNFMDVLQRMVLEVSYEAVADSGYNPYELRGKAVGVYCALNQTDLREMVSRGSDVGTWDFSGILNALGANRISYCLDLKGPSYVIDAAWSSSSSALDQAFKDIKDGRIEAAIVTGGQICVNPEMTKNASIHYGCSLEKPGCPFDSKACGLMRTETVAAVFLQKASESRRCYAKIMNLTCNTSGYVPEGIFVHTKDHLKRLYLDSLNGCGLKAQDIGYIEAHGFGNVVDDALELNSLTEVYCNGRSKPLLIGTVKSNLGNTEGVSSLCSVIKTILALDNSLIPPNLNYDEPNPRCSALTDGSLKVVTEVTELPSPYIAINDLGLAGLNSQLILKQNAVEPVKRKSKGIPNLFLHSATTVEAVKYAITNVIDNEYPSEYFTLLNNIAFTPMSSKPYRGYALLSENPVSEVEICLEEKREIWYIITGMGCQWPGMGNSLMEIDVFANSMKRSAKTLEPFGVELFELMKQNTNRLLQHRKIIPAFVSICAIQIALVDVLKELGIEPDGMVGHSVGELVCAYADGCCTAEQTLLSAYFRGKAVEMADLADGAMAAVGMSWEEAKTLCPANVHPACHNTEDSVTISGLAEPLQTFTSKLQKEGRFAKVVDTYGYAFHCREILSAAPLLKVSLQKVITEPKPKSKRWLSTSYTPDQWDKPEANIADASYFVHNLMSTVHFAEALDYIPTNAIIIEIGPHFLLQSLVKRVVGNSASYLGMMKRNENNMNFMLTTVGKLYKLGLNPRINNLFPPPMYPVPRGVPPISNLLKWDHSATWFVPQYCKYDYSIVVDLELEGCDKYLLDYNIGGRIFYPPMAYIMLVWQTVAQKYDKQLESFPIAVEDFRVNKAVTLSTSEKKLLKIRISKSWSKFEIFEEDYLVASGKLASLSELMFNPPAPAYQTLPAAETVLGEDLYRELKVRGYEYGPHFQDLMEINLEGSQGLVRWSDNWVSFLHAHLLFTEFSYDQTLNLPTGALSIKIDPRKVLNNFGDNQGLKGQPVTYEKYTERCCSPGIEIRKVSFEPTAISPLLHNPPVLEECKFVPYTEVCVLSDNERQKYVEYINVCSKVASKVATLIDQAWVKKLESCVTVDVKSEIVESYLKEQNTDYVLLQVLKDISNPPTKIKCEDTVFEKYLKNVIGSDFMYRALFNEHSLRSVLEIIAENTSNNLSVVEVYNGCYSPLDQVISIMKKYHDRKLHSTLLCAESHYVDIEVLTESGIRVQSLKPKEETCDLQEQDIIFGSFLFGDAKTFQKDLDLYRSLAHKGSFIVLYHREFLAPSEAFLSYLYGEALQTLSKSELKAIFKKERLTVIAKKSDSLGSTLYLLCYHDTNVSPASDSIVTIKDGNYNEWVDQLKLSLTSTSGRVWLVADESPINGVIGLGKCLRCEPGGKTIRCVYVIKDEKLGSVPAFDLKNPFYAEVAERDIFMNVFRDGMWGTFSHFGIPAECPDGFTEHGVLQCATSGDLTSLQWVESPISYELGFDDKKVIHIHYAALNSRDVMLATKKIQPSIKEDLSEATEPNALGLEFSGVTADGRRVMGLTPGRGMSTTIKLDDSVLFDVPKDWTLEEAATVPFAYCTCYHALMVHGKLQPQEVVLISTQSEDLKVAAIRVALSLNCKVYITAYPNERKGYLKEKFPQITEIEIDLMKCSSLADFILNETKGEGVDVVLNTNNNHENVLTCTHCLSESGRFLNIAKYDLALNHTIGLNFFARPIYFTSAFFDQLLKPGELNNEVLKTVGALFNEGIKAGVVKPLERTVFEYADVENAFRYVATRKDASKVVLKIQDEEPKENLIMKPLKLKTRSAVHFYKHKTYIIVGGLGYFGIELTKWILRNGARNVILTSRHGPQTPYHNLCLSRWKNAGNNVQVHKLDASDKEKAVQLIKMASSIGPVGGIFNCAMVLRKGFIENQTVKSFDEVTAAKNGTAKNLDEFSRTMCPQLDYFVCFSSISSSKGIAEMSSDGYANSSMERICENRCRDGIHGLAVQLGIISDIGFVHRLIGEDSLISTIKPQKVHSVLDTLEYFLRLRQPILSSYVITEEKEVCKGQDIYFQLSNILDVPSIIMVNKAQNLADFGVDSLVGSELKNLLEFSYNIIIPIQNLMQMSISDLLTIVEQKSWKPQVIIKEKDEFVPVKLTIPDTILPNSPISFLNTGKTGIPIFMIHPHHMEVLKLKPLAQKILAPVYGLSLVESMPSESISSFAVACIKEIKKYCSKFHLLGVSSGSCLAFEIIVQLQNSREKIPSLVNAIFLDGSSHLIDAFLGNQASDQSAAKEVTDLCNFLMQFSSGKIPTVLKDLSKINDSKSRLFYTVKQVLASSSGNLTNSEVFKAINLYMRATKLSRGYQPQAKLISNLVCIESPENLLPNDVALAKFSLGKFCSGKVDIHRMAGGEKYIKEIDILTAKSQLINNILKAEKK